MVTEEDLQALDYLIWCGNGRQAAELAGTNQSTISRRVNVVLATFRLSMKRQNGRILIQGSNQDLLGLERRVHQGRRWLGVAPLRLEVEAAARIWLGSFKPPNWLLRSSSQLDPAAKADLLERRVLEAWIVPQVPEGDDPLPQNLAPGLRIIPLQPSSAGTASGSAGGTGLGLWVRSDLADHPQIQALATTLQGADRVPLVRFEALNMASRP